MKFGILKKKKQREGENQFGKVVLNILYQREGLQI